MSGCTGEYRARDLPHGHQRAIAPDGEAYGRRSGEMSLPTFYMDQSFVVTVGGRALIKGEEARQHYGLLEPRGPEILTEKPDHAADDPGRDGEEATLVSKAREESRTFRVSTLGCRVNRADSLEIEKRLLAAGFRRSREGQRPDVWVLNTCAVTAEGARKSRKAARRCARSGALVAVTGCAVEMDMRVFADMPGVSLVVSNDAKQCLVEELCPGARPRRHAGFTLPPDLVRVPVKVQDGCTRFCTYCIVPTLRGEERSRAIDSILEEIVWLRHAGAGEAIVCGIDLGSYADPGSGVGLRGLVGEILRESGSMWVRLSSLELSDVDDGLLEMMSDSGLCPHLHLPLQSGDDGVLERMGRKYTGRAFADRVAQVRARVPAIAVTTDVMVGFPGETESAFANTRDLLRELAIPRVHVFKYSPREGTAAFHLGDPVEARTKEARADELREVARASALRFNEGLLGRIIPVLVEAAMKHDPGVLFGRARNFCGVELAGGTALIGKTVQVRITGADPRGLSGEVVAASSGQYDQSRGMTGGSGD
jgi:threonylcarbamoyladenosine tRNA methylthiotransferase MtaB